MKVLRIGELVAVNLESAEEIAGLAGVVEFARLHEIENYFPDSYVSRVAEELGPALQAEGARSLSE